MCDKMAISAYILKIVEKDPSLRLFKVWYVYENLCFFYILHINKDVTIIVKPLYKATSRR